ncbi:Putative protein of unknown function [Podospora comata]|uniref:Uncharacterized protein n=1 Tax=Podospora comata TaxID=48703 RepID=A0ABY6SIL2_PODCO|nr:Putative protein of unknown function [Podospora comata]
MRDARGRIPFCCLDLEQVLMGDAQQAVL